MVRPFSLVHSYAAEHLATLDPAAVALARERGELIPGNRISGAAFLEACGAAFARDFPGFDPESDVHRARALMAVRARLLAGGYDSTYSVQAGHHTWAALHSDQVRRIDSPRREPRASAPEAPSKAREGETSESGGSRAASREVASADVLDLTAFDVSPFGSSGAPQPAPAAIARGRTASGLVVDDAREALAGRRVVIVGDVHGELELLERALSRVDFRAGRGDVLVSVGDLIDRGPQSKEVLDFVRPIRLQVEHTAVADAVQGAIQLADTKARRGEVQVAVAIPDGLPEIQADQHQLTQVFTNLLMNAYEAMGGSGHVSITASRLRAEDGTDQREAVLVQVSDDGPGIPPDVADKVFDPFFTTKPQGSGLGLAIVRKIVDAHDGRIDLRTSVGQGTTIRVTLPVSGSDDD